MPCRQLAALTLILRQNDSVARGATRCRGGGAVQAAFSARESDRLMDGVRLMSKRYKLPSSLLSCATQLYGVWP